MKKHIPNDQNPQHMFLVRSIRLLIYYMTVGVTCGIYQTGCTIAPSSYQIYWP